MGLFTSNPLRELREFRSRIRPVPRMGPRREPASLSVPLNWLSLCRRRQHLQQHLLRKEARCQQLQACS